MSSDPIVLTTTIATIMASAKISSRSSGIATSLESSEGGPVRLSGRLISVRNDLVDRLLHPRAYAVATLLSAATAARIIYASEGASNKRLAVSDGTNWRFRDGEVVSKGGDHAG